MGSPRFGAATALLADGRVLVSGGLLEQRDKVGSIPRPLVTAEIHDPDTGTFKPTGSMPDPPAGQIASTLPDGSVLIAGGGIDTWAMTFR